MLDNWVLVRFVGCLCCFQQYQNPNRTSNFSEIFGGGQGDTYTFWHIISSDFITIAFEIQ